MRADLKEAGEGLPALGEERTAALDSGQIIVLGMHRSGTSAATALLSACGAFVGTPEELTKPNLENPRGFFERIDAREICDALLRGAGAEWWKIGDFQIRDIPPQTLIEQDKKIRRLVAHLDSKGTWALKEPRLCFLLPVFRRHLRSTAACVFVVRHPVEVAQSLRHRNGFPRIAALALWEAHVVAALKASADMPRVFLSYTDLVAEPADATRRIVSALRLAGVGGLREADADPVIDRSLYHQRKEDAEFVSVMSQSQRKLWDCVSTGAVPPVEALRVSEEAQLILREFQMDRAALLERDKRPPRSADSSTADASMEKASKRAEEIANRLESLAERFTSQAEALDEAAAARAEEAEKARLVEARALRAEARLEEVAAALQGSESALSAAQAEIVTLSAQAKAREAEHAEEIGVLRARLDAREAERAAELATLRRAAEAQEAERDREMAALRAEASAREAEANDLAAKLRKSVAEAKLAATGVKQRDAEVQTLVSFIRERDASAKVLAERIADLEKRVQFLKSTASWRITAPMRAIRRAVLRLPKPGRPTRAITTQPGAQNAYSEVPLGSQDFAGNASPVEPGIANELEGVATQAESNQIAGRALTAEAPPKSPSPVKTTPKAAPSKGLPTKEVAKTKKGNESAESSARTRRIQRLNSANPSPYYRELERVVHAARVEKHHAAIDALIKYDLGCRGGVSASAGPLVSVVMPVLNRAAIVRDAIDSILAQTYRNFELLICDDGSTDGTRDVVASIKDGRVKLLVHPVCKGAAAARNSSLRQAKGKYIAYLDSDNLWHPRYLECAVEALELNEGRVACRMPYIDVAETPAGLSVRNVSFVEFQLERQLEKPCTDLNSFVHRADALSALGGFDERLKRRQDYDLIARYTWLREPITLGLALNIYRRMPELGQITIEQKGDEESPALIQKKIESFYESGLEVTFPEWVRKVTVISWDMSRNHFAKAYSVAEAISRKVKVELVSFRFFEEEIFAPLANKKPSFETKYFRGCDFPEFFDEMAKALDAITGDVIYAVKPRLPSMGIALMDNYRRGTPVMVEVNDLETLVHSPDKAQVHVSQSLEALSESAGAARNPYDLIWSEILDPLVSEIPVVFTHNQNLNRHHAGRCLYMRNIKDEREFAPKALDRAAIRESLGFKGKDKVILFGGLVRKHKGINEAVKLLERLNDPTFKLLVVGSRETPDLRELKKKGHGDSVVFLPPQPPDEMAKINLASDLVLLWLDPSAPVSHFQMPYKLTDALAMGPAIIGSPVSDLPVLENAGAIWTVPFGNYAALVKRIKDIFENQTERETRRDKARRIFEREFSYGAAVANFALGAHRLSGERVTYDVSRRFANAMISFREALAGVGRTEASATRRDGGVPDIFLTTSELADRGPGPHRDRTTAPARFSAVGKQTPNADTLKVTLQGKRSAEAFPEVSREFNIPIDIIDVKHLGSLTHQDPEGIAIIMPCIDTEKGMATAKILAKRAGIDCRILIAHDTLRQGFIKTLNATAARLVVKYVVYLAEDAFPGLNWLRDAHQALEQTGSGLLAFNDGKWRGRIAAYGTVRVDWVKGLYDGPILFPDYVSHKADNELTVIARAQGMFVYEPNCTLFEYDPGKVFADKSRKDPALFAARFRQGFDGIVPIEKLAPFAEEYRVSLDGSKAKSPSGGAPPPSTVKRSPAPKVESFTSLRGAALSEEISRYRTGQDPALAQVVNQLISRAEEALGRGPYSVVDKSTLPPSGNPRDYWHPAPYWWPNAGTPDGLPYINRDGVRVPGTRMYEPDSDKYDRTRLQRVFDDSFILALAWMYSGERKYCDHAARILERFFVNPSTGMTPHLNYAQVRMGHNNNEGSKSGIIEMKDFYYYLDAVRILASAGSLSDGVQNGFKNWLQEYLEWLLTSPLGVEECKTTNNHGSYYDLQVGSIAAFLSNDAVLSAALDRAQARIGQHFKPDGSQPRELSRNTSAHYCCFNYQGWINLAELASRSNRNLWSYESPSGSGLIKGARWLLSHMGKDWPYQQIDHFDAERFYPIWFMPPPGTATPPASAIVPESRYEAKTIYFPHDGVRPFWNLALS